MRDHSSHLILET